MSLPASWVDSLFARMAVRYGEKFGRNYAGMDLDAVKADWAEVLDGMTPKAISYCLTNLPIDWPPNAMQFRAAWINAHDDRPTHYLLPPPKPDPERVKAAFERLGKIAAGRSPTQWIHDLEAREAAGEHLSLTQRKYLAQARKNLGWDAAA